MITEVVNDAMIKIQELHVKNPRIYIAHRSKLRLAKKMGQKDTDPLFRLPRLPKDEMDQISKELEEFELPGKSNQDVIDEVFINHKSQREDDSTDDSTCASSRISSRSRASENRSRENRSSDELDEFMSFNRSPGSGGSEASNPEQEFSKHFDLEDLEIEELNQALQDSSAEDEEPVSAAAQLIPDLEQVVEEPQPERSVIDKSINQAINKSTRVVDPEPEQEKYVQLRITEEGEQTTNLPVAGSEASSSRRKSDRVSKPVERFDAAQFKTPSVVSKVPSLRGRARSTLKDMKTILQESWKERPTPTLRDPRARSASRESSASTTTRGASLEKMRTGSIKSSKSVVSSKSKASTRYQVENQAENQVDQGEENSWSDTEDEKECGGGKCHFGAKFENCKSKKFCGTPT